MDICTCPNGIDIDEMPRVLDPECPKHPECCGGGNFYGHESFCDVGHVKAACHAKSKREALELVASFAKDVVDYWPNMSFKTIRIMIPKMQALKEALEMLK
ncbi:MAG TPA: hypothetical protein VII94_00300 [Candidatus Saccharimonadales bacterium]